MITCTVCHSREVEGELFCTECGARLPASVPSALNTAAFTDIRSVREAVRAPSADMEDLRSGQIGLFIDGAPQTVVLEGRAEYVLGREGSEQLVPDLNLNPFGAREKGVSRVHAALRHDRGQLLLIDLGSTNGTRLNGKPLAAHQPARVENGDEIRLGKLTLRITFRP